MLSVTNFRIGIYRHGRGDPFRFSDPSLNIPLFGYWQFSEVLPAELYRSSWALLLYCLGNRRT